MTHISEKLEACVCRISPAHDKLYFFFGIYYQEIIILQTKKI